MKLLCQKLCTKAKTLIDRGKRSMVPNKVKPVQKTNKNPQSFLKIRSESKRKRLLQIICNTMNISNRIQIFNMHVRWQDACVNTVKHVLVCDVYFSFSKIYKITLLKGLCAYTQYSLGPLFLYLTYELVQIFITFNRTDISLPKPVNEYVYIEKNCPNVHCT